MQRKNKVFDTLTTTMHDLQLIEIQKLILHRSKFRKNELTTMVTPAPLRLLTPASPLHVQLLASS